MCYDCWWEPYKPHKRIAYPYIIPCTPGGVICSQRLSQYGEYNFEMKWERKIRGHKFYRQRYWKGKWRH